MADIITKKQTKGISILDAVIIAGGVIFSRQVLGRIIGSNNWISGLSKIGLSVGLNYIPDLGKAGNLASAILLIDGANDIANKLLSYVGVTAKNGVKNAQTQVI